MAAPGPAAEAGAGPNHVAAVRRIVGLGVCAPVHEVPEGAGGVERQRSSLESEARGEWAPRSPRRGARDREVWCHRDVSMFEREDEVNSICG